jgi:16S rRNA (guanine527-N7)-methyltransferase
MSQMRRPPPATDAELAPRLTEGLAALGLKLPPEVQARLLAYVRLLAKWNAAYNLTAVRDPRDMIVRHLLDSLAVAPFLQGPAVLDLGTGAGLPGIPLALARPQFRFVLLDASAKKTRFVTQAVSELGLANVEVVQARVERYPATARFDTILTRAVGRIADMLRASGRLLAPEGRFLAMKGSDPQAELAALPPGYIARAVVPLQVPGLKAARHVVIVESQTPQEPAHRVR